MLHTFGFVLAAVIGLSLGLLGGGGSVLTVPIFVYVMEYEPKLAIAMSLPVVGATSFVGALRHWRDGNFNPRVAFAFGLLAMAGAWYGARMARFVPGVVQLTLLGAVMLAAALSMLRSGGLVRSSAGGAPVGPSDAALSTQPPASLLVAAVVGLGVGSLTGLVGVGGGFLFVPAFVMLLRMPMKTAIGTSLLVIAMNTLAASLGYRGQVTIPWDTVLIFVALAVAGVVAGTMLVRRISHTGLRRAFGYFLLAIAAFILYQNRAVLASIL